MSSTTVTDTDTPSGSVEPRQPDRTTGERVFGGASHTVLIIWSAIVILPLLWTLMTSFKTTREIFASPFDLPQQWNFTNYVNAWTTAGIGSYFVNTVIVVSSASMDKPGKTPSTPVTATSSGTRSSCSRKVPMTPDAMASEPHTIARGMSWASIRCWATRWPP